MKKLLSTLLFLFVVAIFSLSAQADIYPPTLMEPEDGDDGQMPDVILDWAAVGGSGGIVEYEVQIDVTDAFTNPITFPKTDFSGYQMEMLDFGQEYFWRVRAIEGTDISGWSAPFSFTVFETIELSKPNNGADEQYPNVELKAKDRIGTTVITGVDHYGFEADTSENFDSPLLFHGISATPGLNASYLHFGETYYWHARVMHGADTSVWSESRNFMTWPAPELNKPNNGSTDQGLQIDLTWKELTGILDYEIQVADNDAFTDAMSEIVEGLSYTTNGFLTFGEEYFWRVRANHLTDTSDWSEVRNFETAATVSLSSPANGATDVSINPKLEWDMITGVDFFHVQYNNSNNFDDPCCNEMVEGTEDFFQVIYILDKGTTYYWRCRTMQGIDTTAWSAVWSFTTEEEIGIGETAFDGSNINIYPNPSNGKLYIDIAGAESSEVGIRIMDMLGQVHIDETVMFGQGNTSRYIDLNNFANGLYIVKLTRGDQSYSHKITVHK
jgi:hypothetical protein